MGTTRLRRPPTPIAAERARSLAARGGAAALVGSGSRIAHPLVHQVRADGSAVLLLADDEPVLRRTEAGETAVMLELADTAPVPLRAPVRGLLWITGRLRTVDAATGRRLAVGMAEVHPHPALLRLGHGASMVRLQPDSAVLSDAEGSAALAPVELAAARPDPFCRVEHQWLAHLEDTHPDLLAALARHLPAALRDQPDVRIHPLGVDRCGLRLRVEIGDQDNDVRLAWQHSITTADELRAQFARLVGCPLRRDAA